MRIGELALLLHSYSPKGDTQKGRGEESIVVVLVANLRCPSDAILFALWLRLFGTGLEPVCEKGKKSSLIWGLVLAF